MTMSKFEKKVVDQLQQTTAFDESMRNQGVRTPETESEPQIDPVGNVVPQGKPQTLVTPQETRLSQPISKDRSLLTLLERLEINKDDQIQREAIIKDISEWRKRAGL